MSRELVKEALDSLRRARGQARVAFEWAEYGEPVAIQHGDELMGDVSETVREAQIKLDRAIAQVADIYHMLDEGAPS